MFRQSFFKSFVSAIKGILHVLGERNFFIQSAIGLFALLLAVALRLNFLEFTLIIVLIAFILATEAMNSSCERMLDLFTKEKNDEVARIKETLAGSVLIYSFAALVIGIIIFSHALR